MITLRRHVARRHVHRGKLDIWHTFHAEDNPDCFVNDYGILSTLNEIRFPPGGGAAPRLRGEGEVITYVYKGALAQEDSTGSSGVICAGEFQRMTIGPGIRDKETNASRTDWAHVFRISLRPAEVGLACAPEQKRFTAAQRRNVLCVVASEDGRNGSLHIHQDALIYSSLLDRGRHLVHKLLPGRSAWLHMIYGEATLNETVLTQGDGVGVAVEPSVSLTVQENAEILLVDLGSAPSSCGK